MRVLQVARADLADVAEEIWGRWPVDDATEALGESGCTDASIRGHVDGMELMFERESDSLQLAITSAISRGDWLPGSEGRIGTRSDSSS